MASKASTIPAQRRRASSSCFSSSCSRSPSSASSSGASTTSDGGEMVERHPVFNFVSQLILLLGLVVALAPFVIVAIAASQDLRTVNQVPLPLVFGHDFLKNAAEAWQRADLGYKLINSLLFAAGVAIGKVSIALLSAFSLVFFR